MTKRGRGSRPALGLTSSAPLGAAVERKVVPGAVGSLAATSGAPTVPANSHYDVVPTR
jgi:hypothetical protein